MSKSRKYRRKKCSVCNTVIVAQTPISKKRHDFNNGNSCKWCGEKPEWKIENIRTRGNGIFGGTLGFEGTLRLINGTNARTIVEVKTRYQWFNVEQQKNVVDEETTRMLSTFEPERGISDGDRAHSGGLIDIDYPGSVQVFFYDDAGKLIGKDELQIVP